MTAYDELSRAERDLDAMVAQVALGDLPLRATLAALHSQLNSRSVGSPIEGTTADPGLAEAVATALSGTWPVVDRCPPDLALPFPDAMALLAAHSGYANELKFLMQYGAFCSIMPEVHRPGVSEVSGDRATGFTVAFVDEEMARAEIRDQIMGWLVSGTSVGPLSFREDALDAAAVAPGILDACWALAPHAAAVRDQHLALIDEPALLTDEGFVAATGHDRSTYDRFRAAVLTLADALVGLESARWDRFHGTQDQSAAQRLFWGATECASPVWPLHELVRWLAEVAEVPAQAINDLLRPFVLRVAEDDSSHHRADKPFPPFIAVGALVAFTSDLLRRYVHHHGMLSALQREDEARFHNAVSASMEPQLVADAIEVVQHHTGLVARPGVPFPGSEIDLVLYDEHSNTAMQIQAKAPLPPVGARMTVANGRRVAEGLRQLARFRALDGVVRDRVLSHALGRRLSDVTIVDGLLMRHCVGRPDVWQQLGNVAPLNVGMLALLIASADRERHLDLDRVPAASRALLDQIADDIGAGWHLGDYELADVHLNAPVPHYDWNRMLYWRQLAGKETRGH